jgi:TIR domain-containing protein
MADLERWPIFICYRRDDGGAAARRVYEALAGQRVATSDETEVELDPFLDEQTISGGQNWHDVHRPFLERARAFVVICTPGVCMDLRSKQEEDWVHTEIEWWLENRDAAPILIDAIGNGRWIPDSVRQQWQGLQWRRCTKEWDSLAEPELRRHRAELFHWIVGSLLPSAAEIYAKELETEKERVRELDLALLDARRSRARFRWAFALATALLLVSLVLSAFLSDALSGKNQALAEKQSALADKEKELEIRELQNQLGQALVVVENGFEELAFSCNKVQNRNASELQFQIGREAIGVAQRLDSEFPSGARNPCEVLSNIADDAELWAVTPTRGARCLDHADREVPRLLRGMDLAKGAIARLRKAKLTLDVGLISAQDMERRLRELARLDPSPC